MSDPSADPAPFASAEAYAEAVASLTEAAAHYYDGTGLDLTDADYDRGLEQVRATEAAHPDWTVAHGLFDEVAAGTGSGDVPHSSPMLSLDKTTDREGLTRWWERLQKLTGQETPPVVVEPKLDGIAIALTYEEGRLARVVTRGDGRAGEDVTWKVPTATVGLPAEVDTGRLPASVEVRGELVFTKDQFTVANDFRVAEGKPAFVNARNALAGSLRRDDLAAADRPAMSFFAYGSFGAGLEDVAHSEEMADLHDLGFGTARQLVDPEVSTTLDAVVARIEHIGAARADFPCDIDGAVIKADRSTDRAAAGETSAHPRWALAWKFPAEEASTTLLEIQIDVGRTGIHSLRARLEPVFVGGGTVTYATLHNPSDLEARDVRVGDTVVVRRAGDVIPEITGHIARPADSTPFVMPTDCIVCGEPLDQSEKRWRCTNRACRAGAGALLAYACSREALDIDGAGELTVLALLEAGLVKDLGDLAGLTVEQVATLPRFAETSATKLVDGIAAAQHQPLHRLLTALGIRMTGRRMCRRLSSHFDTLANLRAADVPALMEVEGVGERRAEIIRAELDALGPLLDRLAEQGWRTTDEQHGQRVAAADLPLTGQKVVITGAVPGYGRTEAQELAERLGAKVSGSVSKNTTLVVVGEGAGSKAAKAEQLGLRIEPGEWLAALGDEHPA